MTLIRNFLVGGILVVLFLLITRWNAFQAEQIAAQVPEAKPNVEQPQPDLPTDAEENGVSSQEDLPSAPAESLDSNTPTIAPVVAPKTLISVKTDALDILINPEGGDIVQVSLPKHLADIEKEDSAFLLLAESEDHTYVAQSDLIGQNGTHARDDSGVARRQVFFSEKTEYVLDEYEDTLVVDLTFQQKSGAHITKRFTFTRDSYAVDVDYIIENRGTSTWKAAMYGRIKRDDYKPAAGGMFQLQPYLGAATTTTEDPFKKITFEDLDDDKEKFKMEGGWVALVQHYFVSAWVPNDNTNNQFELYRSNNKEHYLLQFKTPLLQVQPGSKDTIGATFYAGPKIIKNLEAVAPRLDLTIDFGMLWFIAKPLFLVMDFIHDYVGNWGWSIVLLTFFIKLVFFYPSAISYRSMAKMRKLMPMMQELRERYGDDRQRMGMETMKLYKKEGVNPLGGCLPMLLQMPVFMALYWMIMESVELRHSPFLFWIEDLSVQDPYFVLPIIMGAIMYIQQKLNPPPADPMQAKIFQMMPIGFTFILMFLPAALTLYMAVNTALSFIQQYVITKQIEKAD